jgi:hypothetical protein
LAPVWVSPWVPESVLQSVREMALLWVGALAQKWGTQWVGMLAGL